ncbi:MAG: hypothetical protein M3Q83_01320 [Pseudomonadota bacterium]|nr:hypothetical protein [Pseudomonadota bacterium]
MRPALSAAAAGLLRSLLARAGVDRDRILLTDFRSVDWQSLTFVGERHEISLRLPAPDAASIVARLGERLEDVEWHVPGQIVADIGLDGSPIHAADGSVILNIEALTIVE